MTRADGILTCYRCEGSCHDCIDEQRGKALLECNYCGARVWTKEFKRPIAKDGYRLQFGRHSGKTFDEVLAEPNGEQYLRWLASSNEKLRQRITDHLAASQA